MAWSDPFGLTPCLLGPIAVRLCVAAAVTIGTAVAAAGRQVYRNLREGRSAADGLGQATLEGIRDGAAAALVGEGVGAALGRVAGTGSPVGTRYMGAGEAAGVAETGTIPATNAAGRPRVIHFTTDAPTTSAAAARARYNLPETPTHMCQFPLCNVRNSVVPTGQVAPGATQGATSMPINGAGRPIPLDP